MTEVLHHATKLSGSKPLALLAIGWAEISAQSSHPAIPAFTWDHSVFWLELDGKVVAALTYKFEEWDGTLFIGFGYVWEGARRRGLYRRLYEAARQEAIKRKAVRIAGITEPWNLAMRSVAEKLGREVIGISYGEYLPQDTKVEEAHEAPASQGQPR
jgi:GNAT superfamily N-acetyltransferase